jgi:Caspase domain/MORN repeat
MNRTIHTALSLFFSLTFFFANAQCLSGDCQKGYGTALIRKKGNVRYTGNFQDRKPHGTGQAFYPDGSTYFGNWQAGMWHGKGTFTLASGAILSGKWYQSRYLGDENTPDPVRDTVRLMADAKPTTVTQPNFDDAKAAENAVKAKPNPVAKQRNTPPSVDNTPRPKIWGLAVGVAAYQDRDINPLKYPQSDAMNMYAFWRGIEGGLIPYERLSCITNDRATRENIINDMKRLFSLASKDDMVIFYFSGHGLKGAFLPHDYSETQNVKLDYTDMNDILSACPAKYKLVIGDACYVGSLLASKSVDPNPTKRPENSDAFYRELNRAAPGTAFLLSSTAEEESFEMTNQVCSIFTQFVLDGMKGKANTDNNDVITITELYDYVAHEVTSLANKVGKSQTPVLRGNFDPLMPVAVIRR